MLLLTKLNEVWSKVIAGEKKLLLPTLSFDSHIYRRDKDSYQKKRQNYRKFLVNREGLFLTGFLPRILKYCQDVKLNITIKGLDACPPATIPTKEYWQGAEADLKKGGFELLDHQKTALRAMIQERRGVIHSPTASGKTIMMLAFIRSQRPDMRVLVLTPSTDLVTQTVKTFQTVLPPHEVGYIMSKDIKPSRITVANIQKMSRLPMSVYHEQIDAVLVDECHHVGSLTGTWASVLGSLPNASLRFGFTATLPYDPEAVMALEGLIGPTITTINICELVSQFVLAQPILKLVRVPYQHSVKELSRFPDVYTEGVVENRIRNRIVIQEAESEVQKGKTVLILVTKVEHGKNLEEMAKKLFPGLRVKFIYGMSSKEIRSQVRTQLETGGLDIAIASVIWKEGIDIPSLGTIINAAGGKFDIFPQQAMGRGLRIHTGKTHVTLIDFFDPSHPYLVEHFGYRITLYFDLGWIGAANGDSGILDVSLPSNQSGCNSPQGKREAAMD